MKNILENRLALRFGRRLGLAIALTLGLGLLSACETAEERAEAHYQTGLELLEEGDVERALIEFRNVFQLNGEHRDARLTYARVQRDRGYFQEAYGQYLRLVEQYPDNIEGRRALAEMALESRNWSELERHVTKARELAPDDLLVQALENTLNYFYAVRDKDKATQASAVVKAQALISQDDTLSTARDIVIDDLVRKQDWYAALEAVDAGLAKEPDNLAMYRLRLGLLQRVGDMESIESQLRDLMDRFPEEEGAFKQALIQFYVRLDRLDDGEAFLRERAASPNAHPDDSVFLVGFLERYRDRETALEEIEKLVAQGNKNADLLRSMGAKLKFESGKHAEAIAEMEALIEGAEPSEETRAMEIDLARMLFRQDNAVGARALVEKVLAEDKSQPDAVKLKANWLIENDETGDAIVLLRDALSLSPRDADLMTLMAKAHEREGNRDLMIEMLTLAVQVSGNAPDESMRYAGVLMAEGQFLTAEGVLVDALRARPNDTGLLFQLGTIYLQLEDWPRAESVIENLEKLDDPLATARATELTARKLAGQEREEELTAMLEGLANDPSLGNNVKIALLRTRLATEGVDAAMEYLDGLLAETPDDPALRFVRAGLLVELERADESEAIFRNLLDEDKTRAAVWLALYRLKVRQNDRDGARQVLDESLAAVPENANLLWSQAGEMERAGNIEGAIGIYESLYKRNSNSLIIANNLASLLASGRDDAESLQRAYTISRRLRDSDVPAFQDTYGWISFRRGNYDEALQYLEPAAAGLPDDPAVQYHLAANLAKLNRNEAALAQFRKTAEMLDPANPPAFAAEVQAEIKRLEAAKDAPVNE